jgi:hypothetical protein
VIRPQPHDLFSLAAGFALGGWFGLAVAALAVVAVRRSPSRALWLPVALLGVAALATVVAEVPGADSLTSTFADDRPFAAGAALAAGIVLLVLLVETAATGAAADAPEESTGAGSSREALTRAVGRTPVPVVAAAGVAGVLRLLLGAPSLSSAETIAVAGIRAGDGFAPDVSPVPVGLAALSPLGPTTMTALLAAGLVLAVAWLVTRLTDARTGTVAAVAAAAVPLTWASPMAITAGLVALTVALAALSRPDTTLGVALGGGALLGIATLCRPELVLVAVAALAWCAIRPRPLPPTRFVAVVAATVAVLLPWLVHVRHRTGTPGLVASMTDAVRSLGELRGGVATEVLTVATMGAAVVAVALGHRWFVRRLAGLLPLATGAILALVLLGAEPDVLALYPALLMACLALARVGVSRLDRRPAHR